MTWRERSAMYLDERDEGASGPRARRALGWRLAAAFASGLFVLGAGCGTDDDPGAAPGQDGGDGPDVATVTDSFTDSVTGTAENPDTASFTDTLTATDSAPGPTATGDTRGDTRGDTQGDRGTGGDEGTGGGDGGGNSGPGGGGRG